MQPSSSPSSISDTPGHPGGADPRAGSKIRVLYLGHPEFARAQFASEAPELNLVVAPDTVSQGGNDRPAVSDAEVDVAFIDTGAPGVNAAALIEELRNQRPGLPVVIAVDPAMEDAARLAVEINADDYTVKSPGWVARLPVRLGAVVSRRRRLNELETSRSVGERLRSIVESAPVSFARVNRSGTILAMNHAARLMVGTSRPNEVLRKSILSFVTAEDRDASRRFIELACAERAGKLEFSLSTTSGTPRRVEASAIKVHQSSDSDGDATAVLVLRDVAVQQRLEPPAETGIDSDAASTAHGAEIWQLREELRELEERCDQRTSERDRVVEAYKEMHAAAQPLAARLQEQELARRTLEAELDEARRQLDDQRASHQAELASVISGAPEALQQLVAAAEARARRSEAVVRQAEAAVAGVGRLEAELVDARRLLEEHRAQQLDPTSALGAADARAQRAEAEHESAVRRVEAALATSQQLETELGDTRRRLEEQRADAASALSARDQLQGGLEAAEARAQRAEAEHESAVRRAETVLATSRQLETELGDTRRLLEEERAKLQRDLAAAAGDSDALRRRAEEAEASAQRAEAERASAVGRVEAALTTSQQLEIELGDTRRLLEEERAKLQRAPVVAAGDGDALRRRVEEAEARAHRAEAEHASAAGRVEAALTTSRRLEHELEETRRRLEEQGTTRQRDAASALNAHHDQQRSLEEADARARRAEAEREFAVRHAETGLAAARAASLQLEVELLQARRSLDEQQVKFHADAMSALQVRNELQQRLDELEARALRAEAGHESSVRQADASIAASRRLEAERDAMQATLEERRRLGEGEMAQALQLRAELERQLKAAEARLELAADAAREDVASQRRRWETERRRLETERDALLATVAEADVARVLILAERDELRQTLAESNKRHAEATAREIANGALEWRLEQSEAECRRLIAERDGALAKRTARRLRRDAAVRALLDSAQHEQLARRWIVRCGHLEQMLEMARAEFQQLAQWAHERVEPSHQDVAVSDAQPAPPGSDATPS